MSMSPSERITFSPIIGRPKLELPEGARMVIWPLLAMEVWDVNRPMPRVVFSRNNVLNNTVDNALKAAIRRSKELGLNL